MSYFIMLPASKQEKREEVFLTDHTVQIRAIREARGMTQRQLAQALQLSPAAVAKWELGQTVPTLENLIAVAEVFQCSLDTLCGRDGPEHTPA